MAIVTGYLIKGNSASPVGATDSGIGAGAISDTFTPTEYLYPVGVVVPNYTVSSSTGAYYSRRVDGTLQYIIGINGANNIHIDTLRACGIVCIGGAASGHANDMLLVANGGGFALESYDFTQDMYILNTDFNNNLQFGWYGTANDELGDTIYGVQANQAHRFKYNAVQVMAIENGRLALTAGGAAPLGNKTTTQVTAVPAAPGGVLLEQYSTVSTTHTDGTFDALFTGVISGNTLQLLDDKLRLTAFGSIVGHAIATPRIQITFGGTVIYDTTALVNASNSTWTAEALIAVTTAGTNVRAFSDSQTPGLASAVSPQITDISGLTLSADTNLVIQATTSGTNAASGDVSLKGALVEWLPAAVTYAVPLSLRPLVWFKANAGAYKVPNGRTVPCSANNDGCMFLQDWSGNGLHAWQMSVDASLCPLYKTAVQNGLPMLFFDGVNDFLRSQLGQSVPQPYSLYFVAKFPTNANFPIIGINDGGNDQVQFFFQQLVVNAGTGTSSAASMSLNTVYTGRVVVNGSSSTVALNGGAPVALSPTSPGTDAMNVLLLAAQLPTAAYGSMYFGELLVFPRVLSGGEETSLLSYLQTKWNHY